MLCDKVPPDDRAFQVAAENDNIEILEYFWDRHPEYAKTRCGHALVLACKNKSEKALAFLLERLDWIEEFFLEDGFLAACARGHESICRALLEDSDHILDDKYVKLGYAYAIDKGHSAILSYLDEYADILWSDDDRETKATNQKSRTNNK